jgi:hypothetical protein
MRTVPALALLSLCLLAACGKSPQEAAVSAATGGKVDMKQEGDKTTVTTADGQISVSTQAGQPLPTDFPKDIWLPDGYSIQTAANFGGAQVLDMVVPGDIAGNAQTASSKMQADGWKQTMSLAQNDSQVLMFEKDGRSTQLAFTKNDDGAHMHVQVTPKQ